jgi:hypothetical protein
MKYDYSIFTKAELVEFLDEHGNDFKYSTKPYQIILDNKIEKLNKEIEKNINRSEELTANGNITKYWENHQEYLKLNKEYDKLTKLRYGRG